VADGTGIQWTDATWNPTRGCSRVSPGCDNCYAMRQARRQSGAGAAYEGLTVLRPPTASRPGVDWSGKVVLAKGALDVPLGWRKPRRIFVNSMSDLFHHALSDEEIAAVFGVMAACPQHTFQVLTKRPERAAAWFKWLFEDTRQAHGPDAVVACGIHAANHCADVDYLGLRAPWPLPNVWLGVSAENQATFDERVPTLLELPAAVRWASLEPLIGPIDMTSALHDSNCVEFLHAEPRGLCICSEPREVCLDWFVVGGESGNGARPCHVGWIRSLIAQASAADVPAFVKQLGKRPYDESIPVNVDVLTGRALTGNMLKLADSHGGNLSEWPEDLRVREFPRAP
jgi:protein gp37